MRLHSVMLRDKVPALAAQHLTADKNSLDMTFEAGMVTIVRKLYPYESTIYVPASNVIFMTTAPPEQPKPPKEYANDEEALADIQAAANARLARKAKAT